MSDAPRLPEDPLVESALRGSPLPPGGTEAGPCPDAVVLGAVAEGTLPEPDRQRVERHLASCPECRVVVGALLDEVRAPRAPARTVVRRGVLLAIAGIAAAAALWLLVAWRGPAERGPDELLATAAAELAQARPDLFSGFRPLDRAERESADSPVLRGGPALVYPSETVLERRPTFQWGAIPGVGGWAVELRRADGNTVWSRSSERPGLPYPTDAQELEPGASYLWEVTAKGPLGESASSRGFHVARPDEVRRFEEAVAVIDARAPHALREILVAHLALRRGYLGEALRAARARLSERPDDLVARGTAYHVLRRLGSSEAESFAPRKADK